MRLTKEKQIKQSEKIGSERILVASLRIIEDFRVGILLDILVIMGAANRNLLNFAE